MNEPDLLAQAKEFRKQADQYEEAAVRLREAADALEGKTNSPRKMRVAVVGGGGAESDTNIRSAWARRILRVLREAQEPLGVPEIANALEAIGGSKRKDGVELERNVLLGSIRNALKSDAGSELFLKNDHDEWTCR